MMKKMALALLKPVIKEIALELVDEAAKQISANSGDWQSKLKAYITSKLG